MRVLVCDDYPLFRRRVIIALEAATDIEVQAEAADSDRARSLAVDLVPDVVLIGMRLPQMGGVHTAADVHEAVPSAALVMVVTPEDEQTFVAAVGAGVTGFVLRDAAVDQAPAIVRAAVAGRCLLLPGVAAAVVSAYDEAARRPSRGRPRPALPDRERAVLDHLMAGRSSLEAAEAMGLAPATAANLVRTAVLRLSRYLAAGRAGAGGATAEQPPRR